MARHASSQPTEVELQILQILWEDGPSIARHIHDRLQTSRKTNYSTTVKMLSVMLDKELLLRDDQTRPQVYRPSDPQQRTQKRMLGELLDKVYNGSAKSLLLHLLSSKKASLEELAEIRQLIDDAEAEA